MSTVLFFFPFFLHARFGNRILAHTCSALSCLACVFRKSATQLHTFRSTASVNFICQFLLDFDKLTAKSFATVSSGIDALVFVCESLLH